MAERRYVAFVSYKHAKHDAAIAKAVHTAIEEYVIPRALRQDGKRKLGVVFRDEEELPVSSDLTDSICRALDASEYLIVICSRAAHESPWVQREVEYFLQHHDWRNAFVILADGEPVEVFPEQLTRLHDPETDTYREIEPLAVDVRGDSTRASLAKLKKHIRKLFAAMLSCPYDALVQREKKRRTRRYTILAALLSAVVLSFMGVLLFKNAELAQANTALQESNNAVLLRESQLLSADSASALEAGDVVTAISSAVAALPSPGNERPYYAPAEAALFDALNPFDGEAGAWMIVETQLEQSTAIADFAFSEDGSRVVTIDAYGAMRCYDASDGTEVWMRQLSAPSGYFSWESVPRLIQPEDRGIIIGCFEGCFAAITLAEGNTRWEYHSARRNGLYLSPGGSEMAFVRETYNADTNKTTYSLVTLNTADGTETGCLDLLLADSMDAYFPYSFFGNVVEAGCYLDDSTFAGVYYLVQDGVQYMKVYLADLEAGAKRMVCSATCESDDEEYDFLSISAISDSEVILCRQMRGDYSTIVVSLLDVPTGETRWETAAKEDQTCTIGDGCTVVSWEDDAILVGYGNAMYVLRREDGTIRNSGTVDGDICLLAPFGGNDYILALDSGSIYAGWEASAGLVISPYLQGKLDQANLMACGLWNQGSVRYDAASYGYLPVSLMDGGGMVARIVSAAPGTLTLAKIAEVELPVRQRTLSTGVKSPSFFGRLHSRNGNLAVIGPMYSSGQAEEGYQLLVIDRETSQLVERFVFERSYDADDILFLPDGSGYVVEDNGSIVLHTSDGQVQTLMEGETLILSEQEGMNMVASMYLTDSAYLHADGSLLTIACSPKELLLWKNAQQVKQLDLPETLTQALHNSIQDFRMALAGQNGYVLLSHYADTADTLMDAFAAYCMETEKWTMIPDEAHGEGNRLVSFAQEKPLFAVCDADNAIRIYNMDAGALETTLLPGLTASAIVQVEFILEDTHLLVRSGEGLLLVFDLAAKENVYRELTEFSQYDAVRADADAATGRLYITCDDVLLCIQTGSWVKLFQLENCLFYAPATNEIYRMEAYADTDEITICTVPTTQELVDGALTLLSQ